MNEIARNDDSRERLDRLAEISQRLLARAKALGASQAEVSCSEERMGRPGWSGAAKFTCNGAGGTPAQRWPPAEANAFRLLNHGYPRYEQ